MAVSRVQCQLCDFSIRQTQDAFEVHLLRHKLGSSKLEFFINLHLEIHDPEYSIIKILNNNQKSQTSTADRFGAEFTKQYEKLLEKKTTKKSQTINAGIQTQDTLLSSQTTQTDIQKQTNSQFTQTTKLTRALADINTEAVLNDVDEPFKNSEGTQTEETNSLHHNLEDLESRAEPISEVDDFDEFSEGAEYYDTEPNDEHETDSATLYLPSTKATLVPSPVQTKSWVDFGVQCSAVMTNKNTQTLGTKNSSVNITTQTFGLIQGNSISVQTNVPSRNQYTHTEVPFLTNASTQCVNYEIIACKSASTQSVYNETIPSKSAILLDELSSDGTANADDSSVYNSDYEAEAGADTSTESFMLPLTQGPQDDIEEVIPYLELSLPYSLGVGNMGKGGGESGQPRCSTKRMSTSKSYIGQFCKFVKRRKSLEYFDSGKIESEPEEEESVNDHNQDSSKGECIDVIQEEIFGDTHNTMINTKVIKTKTASETKEKKRNANSNCNIYENRRANPTRENKSNVTDTPEKDVYDFAFESIEQDLHRLISDQGSPRKRKDSFLKNLDLKPRSPASKRKLNDDSPSTNTSLQSQRKSYRKLQKESFNEIASLPDRNCKEPRVMVKRLDFPTLVNTYIDDNSGNYIQDIIPSTTAVWEFCTLQTK